MKKYIVLLFSLIILICLGAVYAWSVFVPVLKESKGLTTAQTQLIFGLAIAGFTISVAVAGPIQQKRTPKLVAAVGGLLFGAGYYIAGYTDSSFIGLLVGIGILSGFGIGTGYVCALATPIKWFPDKKGLITGVTVAGFGAGAILLSAITSKLFAANYSASEVFKYIGILYGIVVIISSIFLFVPKVAKETSRDDIKFTKKIAKQSQFKKLAFGIFCGTFAGILVVGNIKPIGLEAGVSEGIATLAIGLFSVGNATGRIIWGIAADAISKRVIGLSLTFLGLMVLALIPASKNGILFAIATTLVGFGFAANFVVYAAQTAENYGIKAVGTIYPFIYLFYGLSGFSAPYIGGWLFDITGHYNASIVLAGIVAIIGVLGTRYFENKDIQARVQKAVHQV
ncbi:MAG: OFA family MFS transporter [Armatimonadota bacterium]